MVLGRSGQGFIILQARTLFGYVGLCSFSAWVTIGQQQQPLVAWDRHGSHGWKRNAMEVVYLHSRSLAEDKLWKEIHRRNSIENRAWTDHMTIQRIELDPEWFGLYGSRDSGIRHCPLFPPIVFMLNHNVFFILLASLAFLPLATYANQSTTNQHVYVC